MIPVFERSLVWTSNTLLGVRSVGAKYANRPSRSREVIAADFSAKSLPKNAGIGTELGSLPICNIHPATSDFRHVSDTRITENSSDLGSPIRSSKVTFSVVRPLQ